MLSNIRKANAVFPPQKIVSYGVQGVGKTSFGSTFESPILLPVEDGASAIDIDSFPLATSFNDIVEAINSLHGEHNYKSLVVDSLDWMEPLVWAATCEAHGKDSIEAFGYGKGYAEADKYWRHIMGGFDSLRANKGMTIVLLAHSEVKRVEPPETDPYDRYQMRLHKRAFAMWQEWSDMNLFLTCKVAVQKTEQGFGNERTRGIGTGDRVIHTQERPAWDAKSRWPLPEEIFIGKDRDWSAFHKALSEATNGKYTKGE